MASRIEIPGTPTTAARPQPDRARGPVVDPRRARAFAELLGVDVDHLRQRLDTAREQVRADAARRSADSPAASGRAAALDGAMRAQTSGLRRGASVLGTDPVVAGQPSTGYFALDRPASIFTTGGLELDAVQRAAFDSYAKVVRPFAGYPGLQIQEVVFRFAYSNTSDVDQLVAVTGALGVFGYLGAYQLGATLPDVLESGWGDETTISVNAYLGVHPDDPSRPVISYDADYGVAGADAKLDSSGVWGWLYSDPVFDDAEVARGLVLQAERLVVPSGHVTPLDLVVQFYTFAPNGETELNFALGDRRVACYGLFIHVTT